LIEIHIAVISATRGEMGKRMKYKAIYKMLEEHGTIDKALKMENGQSLNEKKYQVIQAIEYLVDFEKNKLMLDCRYWKDGNCNPINSLILVDYCEIMKTRCQSMIGVYDYAISVHSN